MQDSDANTKKRLVAKNLCHPSSLVRDLYRDIYCNRQFFLKKVWCVLNSHLFFFSFGVKVLGYIKINLEATMVVLNNIKAKLI